MKQKMSKTILSVVLTALLIFSTAVPAFADTGAMTLNGITYTYDTDTKEAAVSDCDESLSGDVTIPSTIEVSGEEYTVTSIGDYAFYLCSGLTSIEIPNSVTSIGDNAFFFCQSLTSIEIPEGVTSIGNNIFYDCGSLTSIVIPNSVTSIGDKAFMGCYSLTDAYIPVNASLGTDLFAYTYQPINVWYYEVLKGAEESPDGKTHVAITALKDKNGAAITEPRVIQDGAMGDEYVIDEVIPTNLSLDHTLTKIEAKEPTCEDVGYEAYWKCEPCGKYFSDKNGENEIAAPIEIPALGHSIIKIEVKPTCEDVGYEAYWQCEFCGTLYSDENGDNEIAAPIAIPALGHSLIKVECEEPTCEDVGYEAYWKCEFCGTLYSDENGDNEIAAPIEIPALGHSLIKVDGKEPTCEDIGYEAYWKCEFCDKYFSDENATTEITLDDTVIKAAGHDYKDGKCTVCEAIDPDFKAVIIEGANGEWQKGAKDGLSFTSNASYEHFQKVQVDGKDLDASNYTVKEGSTIVTLKASYLETLSVGKHTLSIVSDTGTAATEFTIKAAPAADNTQSPQTGDSSNLTTWFIVMLTAGTALSCTLLYSRKRKYSK